MRDQDADCVAKPCCTSRCCNSMGSRAFCDTRTGGDAHWVCTGLHPRDERTKPGEAPQDAPNDVLGRRDAVGGTPSLCQEPSETDAGTSTLVGNAPLSVQNRTNLPDTLGSDSCRAGFAPAKEQRLLTAHGEVGLTYSAQKAVQTMGSTALQGT